MALNSTASQQRVELASQRRRVDFDTYDVTVDELLRRIAGNRIDIAPIYQRQFRWDRSRQSRLIESIFLGIPVPPLFMATNSSEGLQNQWEVVDGLQRLVTLAAFAGSDSLLESAPLKGAASRLTLTSMEKLLTFEGLTFEELPDDVRSAFEDRPIRVVVLNDKSDLEVRYDLFERLNTGGIRLSPQEIRECVFRGDFMNVLQELSETDEFRTVVRLPSNKWKDGTPQDYVLRFFAFLDGYQKFEHLVVPFLNAYAEEAHRNPAVKTRRAIFYRTFSLLAQCFPSGLTGRTGQTPVNLFEGVSVGCALALRERSDISAVLNPEWVDSQTLRDFTQAATNSRPKVRGRIEYCRDRFLDGSY